MYSRSIIARAAPRFTPVRAPIRRRMYSSEPGKRFAGAEDNEFNREREHIKQHAGESGDFWGKLCIYVVIPCLIVGVVNAKIRWDAHWEHVSHEPPRSERPEYPYQNIRTKNFFWGDGDKTLFWNDKVNYHKRDE
ncbi:cytochrome c oxidase-like protein subunit VIa [Sporormia fimetaria CBS 119925]|uniref:Cytochrome c oxidase subunit n=1 Tax=Sporormia fimetaria CBS 119925 TaxID=1340428 RepID=A0A6A6VQ03_9PLEO|nr:cytochrome c oxidase-like protein subunit VIa [Sporormia fimetaria CBS 119925]